MKTLTAALLASAFIASPALACSFGKTASYEKPMVSASKAPEQTDQAMSTYDPAGAPKFEEAEATEEKIEPTKEPVAE